MVNHSKSLSDSGFAMTMDDARRRYFLNGQTVVAPALPGGLYIVATPIGNLGDIGLRALATLAAADAIACEDTRVSRKLTGHYGIETPLIQYHEHNADAARPKIMARLDAGEAVALISDAGTPLISDPGYKLVVAARETGHAVHAIPGASALLVALASAGQPTDRFFFEGFLPAKTGQRQTRISDLAAIPATLVFYESGPRLHDCLSDLASGLGDRAATVCRELTKLHEEIRRETLNTLAKHYAKDNSETRGEFVVVVAPPAEKPQPSAEEIDELIRASLKRASVKDAVAEIVEATGLPKRDVYQRALTLAKDSDGAD